MKGTVLLEVPFNILKQMQTIETVPLSGSAIDMLSGVNLFFTVVLTWSLFSCAEKPGWAALIPIYRSYTFAKTAKRTARFWVGFVCASLALCAFTADVVMLVKNEIQKIQYAGLGRLLTREESLYLEEHGYEAPFPTWAVALSTALLLVFLLAYFAQLIRINNGFSDNFGHGAGTTVLLTCFPVIGLLVIFCTKSTHPYQPYKNELMLEEIKAKNQKVLKDIEAADCLNNIRENILETEKAEENF